MADEKKIVQSKPAKVIAKVDKAKADKAKAAGKKARKFNLKKAFASIGRFFRDVWAELKKVTWPSRKEYISYTIAVVVFVVIFGTIIYLMDIPLQLGINIISSIGS